MRKKIYLKKSCNCLTQVINIEWRICIRYKRKAKRNDRPTNGIEKKKKYM